MTSWEWSDAGSPADIVEIESVDLKPDPPRKGEIVRATIPAHVSATINRGARVEVTVQIGLIKLLTKTYDLLERMRDGDPAGGDWTLTVDTASAGEPVPPGNAVLTLAVNLPAQIPPAKFHVVIRAYNDDDADLFALDLNVDFSDRF
ncbi:ML domain-containing protein [Embleya sp. NBC_00896]|uniref:ML domain-containing protein n=1 Tax=Embleya sp. NBC_00896 TaxID=2975961 RepID=UPI002F91A3D1|nr:ML domain-containing protein [Embleya sp. NBC_00896]